MTKAREYTFDGYDSIYEGDELLWDDIPARSADIIIDQLMHIGSLERQVGRLKAQIAEMEAGGTPVPAQVKTDYIAKRGDS